MIFSGKLTENLDFYRVEETQSASGFKHTEELFMFSCKAEKIKYKGRYEENADELFHNIILNFRMRFRKINETNIVVYNEKRYRINSVDRYPLNNEIVIQIELINE